MGKIKEKKPMKGIVKKIPKKGKNQVYQLGKWFIPIKKKGNK